MEGSKNEILDYTDEDGPYIEIELDTAVTTTIHTDDDSKNNCMDDDVEIEQQEEEYKLRISISSTISVSLQNESIVSVHSDANGADDTRTCADNSQATMSPQTQHSGVSYTDEVEFPAQNKLLSSVSFSPWQSPHLDGQTTILGTNSTRVIPYDNVDVLYAPRKQPSMTTTRTTTANGIMMTLLIKFRGIKIRSLFASLIKPIQNCKSNNSSKKSITFFQCYQKEMVNASIGRDSKHWNLEDTTSLRKSKKMMEMDFGAFKGVFNGIGGMSRRRSKRRTDASSSCNNSPIHEGYSKDNSIQAAIAYCKSSFGQTSDFTFTTSITSTPSRFVAYSD
ncbi:uncharacterized protein LOC123891224 [Trifolium pratense]|uniref:uncharacterized protein LOC123891224 n=1 Tax=Trifolium pratense TaxID=57577 RepID=UPI001E69179D|nr:uncharacterized protein LOC123891224 [Trifolium pratense]